MPGALVTGNATCVLRACYFAGGVINAAQEDAEPKFIVALLFLAAADANH